MKFFLIVEYKSAKIPSKDEVFKNNHLCKGAKNDKRNVNRKSKKSRL